MGATGNSLNVSKLPREIDSLENRRHGKYTVSIADRHQQVVLWEDKEEIGSLPHYAFPTWPLCIAHHSINFPLLDGRPNQSY